MQGARRNFLGSAPERAPEFFLDPALCFHAMDRPADHIRHMVGAAADSLAQVLGRPISTQQFGADFPRC
jgi:hypothetical protein